MAIKPVKFLKITQTIVESTAIWEEEEAGDMYQFFPYKWKVDLSVEATFHGSPSTQTMFTYDGLDIKVGDWVATSAGGVAVKIVEIISQTSSDVQVIVEDVDRFNTILDSTFSGAGIGPDGTGYVFELDDAGLPALYPGASYYMDLTFQTDLMARFSQRNQVVGTIPVNQEGHTFVVGDAVYLKSDGSYALVTATEENADTFEKMVGVVSEVGVPGVNNFAITPNGKIKHNITPALPAGMSPGDFAYIDPANPGKLTATKPAEFAIPVYMRLHSDTSGILLPIMQPKVESSTGAPVGPLGYYESAYVLADLAARAAIPAADLELGDSAYVANDGTDRWAYYKVTSFVENVPVWTMITSEGVLASTARDKIFNSTNSTRVETMLENFENTVVMVSDNKRIADYRAGAEAIGGERIVFTAKSAEVQFKAENDLGTNNVDVRILPQGQGHVFFGVEGDGLVQAERTFTLRVKGGDSGSANAGGLILEAGDGKSGNYDGGDIIIKQSSGFGTGNDGAIFIEDANGTKILDIKTAGENASNWLELRSGASDIDVAVNGVVLGVSAESTSTNVDMLMKPKGNGLVRVGSISNYTAGLNAEGTGDAFVTKAYVLALAGLGEDGDELVYTAGSGLDLTNGVFSALVGANTVGVDGVGNIIVKSSAVNGQILQSTGVAGQQAVWANLNLSNDDALSGALGAAFGGTGLTEFTSGDILVGGADNALTRLALGNDGSVLKVIEGVLAYGNLDTLYNADGAAVISTRVVEDSINNFEMVSSAIGVALRIEAVGEDEDVSMVIAPKGDGQILAASGYTQRIGENPDTLVTRKWVEDVVASGSETFMRELVLDEETTWESEITLGSRLPNVDTKNVYVHRAMVNVKTPISGGGASNLKIMSGTDVVMEAVESDILETGVYVTDLPENFSSTNTELKVLFTLSDGTTLATPEQGEVTVSVYYRIR